MNEATDTTAAQAGAAPAGAPPAAPAGAPTNAPRSPGDSDAAPRAGGGHAQGTVAGRWLWILVAIALALAAVWFAQSRLARLERDVARRLQAIELREQQRDEQLRQVQANLRDTQAKAAVLEAKLADSVGQQAQLRQLYDEMARSRGDMMLADVENSVMIAAQQLHLTGNVQSALLALQDADQALARSNLPAMIGLRRVIGRDIERLRAVPVADLGAAVNRLDAVLAAVDQMPLLAHVAPVEPAERSGRADDDGGLLGLPGRMVRTGQRGWDAFVAELRQLVRVQRVDQPDALLLAPEQRYFARENLRLQLLNARVNLLTRNDTLLRGDLTRAVGWIESYYDRQHKTTAAALATLRQLQSTRLSVELPSLADSIGAVRTARAASEKPAR